MAQSSTNDSDFPSTRVTTSDKVLVPGSENGDSSSSLDQFEISDSKVLTLLSYTPHIYHVKKECVIHIYIPALCVHA